MSIMNKLALVAFAVTVGARAHAATRITSIDFKGRGDPHVVEIKGDGPVEFEKSDNTQDNQVVIEIKDAEITKAAQRKIDTSSFKSKVSLISAYQVDVPQGEPKAVRVVIQMREPGSAEATQEGNLIKVAFADGSGGGGLADGAGTDGSGEGSGANGSASASPSGGGGSTLDEFMVNKNTRQFSGRPITLHVRDVEAADVFRLIGEASGFNIILGDDVKGKVTLSMTDVPWDQALDVVLHTLRLGVERNNNILRIVTLANLTAEKQEELRALRASEATAPRVTRVFPISYAKLEDLAGTLSKFTSAATAGASSDPAGGAPTVSSSSVVQIDNRTNSLIVRDLPENIERMKKLIEILDAQTPQVLIEAKVIEATEGFAKNIAGSLGFGGLGNPQIAASFAGGNPVNQLIGTPGVFPTGVEFGATTLQSGSLAVSPTLNFIPGLERLNAVLNLGENESQVKVIASPKTVVLNKAKSSIVQGTPVLVSTNAVSQNGTLVPTNSVQTANLSLTVTPVVTNDSGVLMELNVTRDIPFALGGGNNGVANRNINTVVLVDSGSTLVIGGIYTMTVNHQSSGFPILRKIPLIGPFFGSESETTDRSELFIFITPRILNPKEAGLAG